MTAEFSANTLQNVSANGSVIFTETPVPAGGLIYHRDESGLFRLGNRARLNNCCCRMGTRYLISFGANIQIPTGGTAGEEISLALFVDGEEDPSSTMIDTPAAVEQFRNVGTQIVVEVPWMCNCSSVSVKNTSTQEIQVQNANMTITLLCGGVL